MRGQTVDVRLSRGRGKPRTTPASSSAKTTPVAFVKARKKSRPSGSETTRCYLPSSPPPSSSSSKSIDSKKSRPRSTSRKKKGRLSLTEQLRAIGNNAGRIASDLEKKMGIESQRAVMRTSSRFFRVGKLTSKYPSPVHFSDDYCTYSFHHPYQRKIIDMQMNYRDMGAIELNRSKRELRFKIQRKLEQFGSDYDPLCTSHIVAIGFNSDVELNDVRRKVMPLIRNAARGSSR